MVKPGGRIVFLEPNPFNLLYYLQILFTPRMTWSGERGIPNMRKSLVFEAMHTAGGFYPGARRVQTGVETKWPPRAGQYDKGRAVLPTVLGVGLSRQSQIAGRMPGRVVGSDGASSGLCRRLPRNDQPVWVPIRGHHGNGWLTGKSDFHQASRDSKPLEAKSENQLVQEKDRDEQSGTFQKSDPLGTN